MHPHHAGRHPYARDDRTRRAVGVLAAAALAAVIVAAAPLMGAGAALAAEAPHADGTHERKPAPRKKAREARAPRDTPFGREGDPRKATRTIRIEMSDTMRYFPDHVSVKKGQTVRFNLSNSGGLPHEMILGTMDDLKKHAALMKQNVEVPHDDPNVAYVDPGQSGRIVWQFTRTGEFYYGCLVPGHFEAGMIGTIVVLPDKR
jgi:uncharacterized cupredoxin-like copper-binding protein